MGDGQSRGGVAKAVEALTRPSGLIITLTIRPWGRSQGRGAWPRPWGVAKAVEALPKAVGALPRRWERGQGLGGVAKDYGAWPRP